MAEIKIKKKKPVWPWIVLLVVVLATLVYIFYDSDDDVSYESPAEVGEMDTSAIEPAALERGGYTTGVPALTESYLYLIRDSTRLLNDPAYAREALLTLGWAIQATAQVEGAPREAPTKSLDAQLEAVARDTASATLARQIKEVGNATVVIFQSLDAPPVESAPQLRSLSKSISRIDPNKEVYEQRAAVRDFFNRSGEILTMSN